MQQAGSRLWFKRTTHTDNHPTELNEDCSTYLKDLSPNSERSDHNGIHLQHIWHHQQTTGFGYKVLTDYHRITKSHIVSQSLHSAPQCTPVHYRHHSMHRDYSTHRDHRALQRSTVHRHYRTHRHYSTHRDHRGSQYTETTEPTETTVYTETTEHTVTQ